MTFPLKPNDTILLWDSETSGLPLFKEPSSHPGQPRIIQLTALLCNAKGDKLSSLDVLVDHPGLVLDEEIVNLTGIYDGKCRSGGVAIDAALGLFLSMWRKASVRVAHNESFDARMVRIELKRAGQVALADEWKEGNAFCTMQATKPILRLPPTAKMQATTRFANAFKSPNLGEAYKWATGKEIQGAHNAMYDVLALKAVFFALGDFYQSNGMPERKEKAKPATPKTDIAEAAEKTGATDGQGGGSPPQNSDGRVGTWGGRQPDAALPAASSVESDW